MNKPIRSVLVVAVAFLLSVCLFGLRFVCDPTGLRELIQEGRRREQIQQLVEEYARYHESRERIVCELIAQRCSLSEALAQWEKLDRDRLQELDREWPDYAFGIAQTYRSEFPDADSYYQIITAEAAILLRDRPEEAASELRRLEKEYQQFRTSRQTLSTAPVERTGLSR